MLNVVIERDFYLWSIRLKKIKLKALVLICGLDTIVVLANGPVQFFFGSVRTAFFFFNTFFTWDPLRVCSSAGEIFSTFPKIHENSVQSKVSKFYVDILSIFMNFGKSRKNLSCTRLYPGRISGKKSVKKKNWTGPDRSKKNWTGPDRLPTLSISITLFFLRTYVWLPFRNIQTSIIMSFNSWLIEKSPIGCETCIIFTECKPFLSTWWFFIASKWTRFGTRTLSRRIWQEEVTYCRTKWRQVPAGRSEVCRNAAGKKARSRT